MSNYTQDHRIGRLTTNLGEDALLLLAVTAEERLSESYSVTIEAMSQEAIDIQDLLGTPVGVTMTGGGENVDRDFGGIVWEYSELTGTKNNYRYQLVLRPEVQFLTLNKRNRIFQNRSVVDIVTALLPGAYRSDLNGSYAALDYCVQYQESDFAFISRLMEYEGIYYYYEHYGTTATMVLVDSANAHKDLTPAKVAVDPYAHSRANAPLITLSGRRGLAPAKVTVADYDFEAPTRALLDTHASSGSDGDWSAEAEIYDFPAKYTAASSGKGQHYGSVWLDAHRRRIARSFAEGQLFAAAVGRRVTIDAADTRLASASAEYLIVGTRHQYQAHGYRSGSDQEETFDCAMELMPADMQYRPAMVTPRPRILGPQTAVVVGPMGEEIHTDKHGRIKVLFHWDREGKKDDTAGCFIRVMQSGAGQGWGSFALPRIGQEVVVSFLDGDPDRPLVTGAVYNATNTPPETLPDNKTQFGLKTRITKGGGGFNRLWFEDKKGSEIVWFRAERDYKVNIVNQDEERVYDKGSRTTTFKEGDTTLTIIKGKRTATIESDDTTTVKTGNVSCTIEKGDQTHLVKLGKRTTEIFGNETLEVKTGNVSIKVTAGKHATQAMQAIELTCGASKVKMDPASITIESAMITIDAKAVLKLKAGAMITTDGGAMHMMKAGLVMIN